jgi:hypothetical protein
MSRRQGIKINSSHVQLRYRAIILSVAIVLLIIFSDLAGPPVRVKIDFLPGTNSAFASDALTDSQILTSLQVAGFRLSNTEGLLTVEKQLPQWYPLVGGPYGNRLRQIIWALIAHQNKDVTLALARDLFKIDQGNKLGPELYYLLYNTDPDTRSQIVGEIAAHWSRKTQDLQEIMNQPHSERLGKIQQKLIELNYPYDRSLPEGVMHSKAIQTYFPDDGSINTPPISQISRPTSPRGSSTASLSGSQSSASDWIKCDEGKLVPLSDFIRDNFSNFGEEVMSSKLVFDGFDPLEFDNIRRALIKKQVGNAIVTGNAGDGKTELVRAFVKKVKTGIFPEIPSDTEFLNLSTLELGVGSKWSGVFDTKLKALVDYCSKHNVILVADEIHALRGAGTYEGRSSDVFDFLKPYLADGRIKIIGLPKMYMQTSH